MDCKFLKDAGSRSDRIRSAEQRKICLLCCCKKTPRSSLVSCDVSVEALLLVSRLDVICIRNSLDVGCIVIAVLKHLLVRSDHLRLLLSELLLKILEDVLHRTVVDVASHSESEHVLAFVDGLLVQTAVLEAFLRKGRDRSHDDGPVLDIEFGDRIVLEACSLETILVKCIRVDKYHGCSLEPLRICLEGCRVHGHKEIAEVTRGGDMLAADVYLKTGNAGNGTMRSSDFCRIIREC